MCIITITTTFYIKTNDQLVLFNVHLYYDNNSNNNNKNITIDINKTNFDIISKS